MNINFNNQNVVTADSRWSLRDPSNYNYIVHRLTTNNFFEYHRRGLTYDAYSLNIEPWMDLGQLLVQHAFIRPAGAWEEIYNNQTNDILTMQLRFREELAAPPGPGGPPRMPQAAGKSSTLTLLCTPLWGLLGDG